MPTVTASSCVEDAVYRRRGDLVELSHSIHAEPELAFAEHRSCAKTQELVAEHGFEITKSLGGLDTAFRADFGSGPLVVGICAEYDALPGIGHACGHNIIAASAVGTALALAEVADELGLTVVLLGTPAEEAGGGKVLLLNAGAFDDIAATVMLHPGPLDIAAARSLVEDGGRLLVLFQPHLYSRTAHLAHELAEALAHADVACVTDVYAAREDPVEGVSGKLVVDELTALRPGMPIGWGPTLEDAAAIVAARVRPGDLVLTVGAGDVDKTIPLLLEKLAA